ncbi:hypothetical protein [Streptomyces ochraceiscleroticus]|uniref:Uncharacterized protein n=1 Tax=Streptomyces ochraceiscleroticus TaxID=47761 RepID=A0ABW1MJY7_9ACTN|nr:hypothetical protein [Streptomyces ochraceiscleroticus]
MSDATLVNQPPALHPALEDERFADAFASDATVRQPDFGTGLWAVQRNGATSRLLYVQNTTDQELSFRPSLVLGDDATPLFLAGDVVTAGEEGAGLICRLAPQSHVWLGRTDTAHALTKDDA